MSAAVAAAVYAQLSAVGDIMRAIIATGASIVVGVLTLSYFHPNPNDIASSTQKKATLLVCAICAIIYVASSAYTLVTAKDNGMDDEEFVLAGKDIIGDASPYTTSPQRQQESNAEKNPTKNRSSDEEMWLKELQHAMEGSSDD